MTAIELFEMLRPLVENGKADYEVCTEGYCCETDDVEVNDRLRKICIE